MCFLCGETLHGSKDVRKVLSGEEFDKNLRNIASARGYDKWSVEVEG